MIRTLTLLLVAQVCGEWVEISQHHYRKPIRTHSYIAAPDRAIQVDDTTKPWSYNNHSVTEHNWNKSPANTNIGNVKRIQLVGSTIRTTEKNIYEDKNTNLDDDIDYKLTPNYGPTRKTTEMNQPGNPKIIKVPNLGNIKRVQLNNSPVKSPVIHFKGLIEKTPTNLYKSTTPAYDLQTEVNKFEDNQKPEKNNRRIYVNEVKQHGTERIATFPPDDDGDFSHFAEQVTTFFKKGSKQVYNNYTTVENGYSTKPTFTTEAEDFKDYETQVNRFSKINNSKSSEGAGKINVFTTENTDIQEEVNTKKNIQSSKPEKITTKHDSKKINRITDFEREQSYENNVHHSANDDKQIKFFTDDLNINATANIASSEQEIQYENQNKKENKDNKLHTEKYVNTKRNKVKTMENLIKFLRVVADTISTNSRRSFGGKMQYLHELKDSILANIEERIDSTWPDDDSAGARRQSRSARVTASPRGHVQFPSSESALMTISFLTFAVFLIKLVLQVIQTYKHKAMMVAPLVVASSGRDMFSQRDHGYH